MSDGVENGLIRIIDLQAELWKMLGKDDLELSEKVVVFWRVVYGMNIDEIRDCYPTTISREQVRMLLSRGLGKGRLEIHRIIAR